MEADVSARYNRILNGLLSRTLSGDIDWESADDPWSSGQGYDASLARSSFQLRLENATKKVRLTVIGEDGSTIVTLGAPSVEDDTSVLARIYQAVADRENRLVLQRLDRVIEDLDAAEEPPF